MALMEKARLAATVYSLLMFSFVFNVVQIIARYVLVLAIETPVDTLCNLMFFRKNSHIQPTRRQQSSVVAVVPFLQVQPDACPCEVHSDLLLIPTCENPCFPPLSPISHPPPPLITSFIPPTIRPLDYIGLRSFRQKITGAYHNSVGTSFVFWLEYVAGVKIVITGDLIPKNERVLLICNHVRVEWLHLICLAYHLATAGAFKTIMKVHITVVLCLVCSSLFYDASSFFKKYVSDQDDYIGSLFYLCCYRMH